MVQELDSVAWRKQFTEREKIGFLQPSPSFGMAAYICYRHSLQPESSMSHIELTAEWREYITHAKMDLSNWTWCAICQGEFWVKSLRMANIKSLHTSAPNGSFRIIWPYTLYVCKISYGGGGRTYVGRFWTGKVLYLLADGSYVQYIK